VRTMPRAFIHGKTLFRPMCTGLQKQCKHWGN
jgi:hypothetical protein